MLIPPDEDGKIRHPTDLMRILLGKSDKPISHIQPFASPGEALQHMEPTLETPDKTPDD